MCLYPRILPNPKYKPNKKNGGNVPQVPDDRVKVVPIGCGKCYECRKQRRMDWVARLMYEYRHSTVKGKFVTLTYSDDALERLRERVCSTIGGEVVPEYDLLNLVVSQSVKWWRESVRAHKNYHKIEMEHPKYWLCSELGHLNDRLHLHGFVWSDQDWIYDKWQFGWHNVKPISGSKIKYATKYVMKTNPRNKGYIPKICCSNGIGAGYESSFDATNNRYIGEDTNEGFRTTNGYKIALPRYYRNKIYTESEREKLWLHKLDKAERWVMGTRVSVSDGEEEYFKVLKDKRVINRDLGYGGHIDWEEADYRESLKAVKL